MLEDALAPRSVLIVHPLPLFAEALGRLVEDAGCRTAGTCSDLEHARRLLWRDTVDVVLFDATLAAEDGPLHALHAEAPGAHLVMLARDAESSTASWSTAPELDGVVLASSDAAELGDVVRRVSAGQSVFPCGWWATVREAGDKARRLQLSQRQFEVLELLAEGCSNDEIARRLVISTNTVKFHVAAIYERLGVHTRVEAAAALATR